MREGVGPGMPVGLCATAEREAPVGFLAILAVGGVVVPLDPSLPPERLRGMSEGVGCRLVLTSDAARRALPADMAVLALSEESDCDGSDIFGPFDPDRLAVIYHTSGSTGRPKPVALAHRSLSSRLLSMMAWFGITEDEVVCVGSTLAFDPFLQQLFFPLCGGGTLWLPERALLLDPARFWAGAALQGVTHINLVPSQIEALLHRPPTAPLASLRRVVMGGESLPPGLPVRIAAALGPVAIFNMYGPTEATVDASGHRVDPSATDPIIPIGRPLPGCRIRILDEQLRRVPTGEVGELCIGGAGLAIEYLGLPDETARAFVADPFGQAGDRLYRTGDLAQWRDDGNLLFLGRRDDQVKIRGQRLELGEVEAVLRTYPGVTAAVAGKWDEATGGPALMAHVVGDIDPAALCLWLAERLPAAAVPAHILRLDRLPVLPSGKVDRKALPKPAFAPVPPPASSPALERKIAAVWADLLGRTIEVSANLFEMGAHSLLVPRALTAIEAATGQPLSAVDLFRFPTVAGLARHLSGPADQAGRATVAAPAAAGRGKIAIVGMAFRFPGAVDRDGFWTNLMAGTDSLRRHDPAALRRAGVAAALVDHPDFVPVHGAIDDTDRFDAGLFGYSHGEAAEIDPQQRLLLQLAWHAMEDAACDPEADGPVGVFAGVGFNAYLIDNLHHRIGFAGGLERYSVVVGADKDFAGTRIAYKLGLTGPAMTVNSACSTSLSATMVAVDSLRAGRCRVALVGAASLGMFSPYGYIHAEGGIASKSGVCRPFDAAADGTVGGAGAAILVLKRLEDALADQDTIHAMIEGIGIANDGADKAAFAAPSVDGQVAAISAALADAGVAAEDIGFVEGHGTATVLGDPIEVTALNIAYRGVAPGSIPLGSAKGNIGHLDAAAGMAGLIKAVLAVGHGMIPPTAHFTTANPVIPFAEGPFRVTTEPEPWRDGARRLAGVSGFGMGGTNIHVIIGQAPVAVSADAGAAGPVLVTLSAATEAASAAQAAVLADYLEHLSADVSLAAVASSEARRRALRFRRTVVAASPAAAAEALRTARPAAPAVSGGAMSGAMSVALLFPGQGAQRPGMATGLYGAVPAFRAVIDAADAMLAGTPIASLRALLLADGDDAEAMRTLSETQWTQPALFVTEYATAMALQGYGVRPSQLAGHSVGEYVAACLAGVMDFEDALRLVAARGRLIASAPRGAMLAVSMTETELAPLLERTGTDLAAVNGARQCVASGSAAAIDALAEAVAALERPARRLPVSHGFHSRLMEPILDAFAAEVAGACLSAPVIPIVSTLTGLPLTAVEATDPGYWVRHLRGAVRFADALTRLAAEPTTLLVEAGPGVTLTRLARAAGVSVGRAIAVQPPEPVDGWIGFLEALGQLWTAGLAIDRLAAGGGLQRRVPLPGYPFETVRLWVEPGQESPAETPLSRLPRPASEGIDGTAAVIAAVWQDVLGRPKVGPDEDFLALGGDSLIAVRIAARLRERLGREVEAGALFREGTVAGLARLLGAPDRAVAAVASPVREEGWL
jgi:amino acid adenylation domain-containing protein